MTMTININIKSSPLGRSALVTYGSETGNAQDVADELGRLAQRLHFLTRVCHLDAVELVCAVHLSGWRRRSAELSSQLYHTML